MFTIRPKNNGGKKTQTPGEQQPEKSQDNGIGLILANGNHKNNANGHAAEPGLTNGYKNGNGHKPANGRNGHNGHNGHSGKVETVLGPGVHYKGTLNGAAGVRIEGSFDGDINIKGAVVIADGAKVTADIRASAVSVGGNVKGNITAGKVEILSTGRVWGDLTTTAFASEEGAFLRGAVKMEDDLPDPTPPETAVIQD
jgi:cytoskeletal protein CcmA (bactofilin family)